jgi:hypothetical protein
MLGVSGPLFVLTVAGSTDPVLFVLSSTHYDSNRDYNFIVPIESTTISADESKVYFKFADGHELLISTDSTEDATALVEAVRSFGLPNRRPGRPVPQTVNSKDPTYRHLVRVMSKGR